MTFNAYKLIKYHLYLLQLENYELGRFWKLVAAKGWFPPKEQRKDLVWTPKVVLLFVSSEVFILLASLIFSFYCSFAQVWQMVIIFFVSVYILNFVFPLFLSVASIIVWPIDFIVKQIIISRAKNKIKGLKNLKIIGIAGSYGKTTMKDFLATVLSAKFNVAATPESVNTPVGIARWVFSELNGSTQIAIVEMGEHYKGDIREICKITPPKIAVVTGINQAHMERMGSLEDIAATILEISEHLTMENLLVVNADDEFLFNYVQNKKLMISFYGLRHPEYVGFYFENVKFDSEKLSWAYEIPGAHLKGELSLLGEYGLGLIVAAQQIIGHLRMPDFDLAAAVAKVKPVIHRLQPLLRPGNILVIDDAYNGNPDGAAEAIKVLSRFPDRRKIYITPGLVETGSSAAEVHRKIGQQLASVADVVILIKNSVTPFIAEGLKSQDKIKWFNSAQEAHSALQTILQPNDVILFQNDWGDQYL